MPNKVQILEVLNLSSYDYFQARPLAVFYTAKEMILMESEGGNHVTVSY